MGLGGARAANHTLGVSRYPALTTLTPPLASFVPVVEAFFNHIIIVIILKKFVHIFIVVFLMTYCWKVLAKILFGWLF